MEHLMDDRTSAQKPGKVPKRRAQQHLVAANQGDGRSVHNRHRIASAWDCASRVNDSQLSTHLITVSYTSGWTLIASIECPSLLERLRNHSELTGYNISGWALACPREWLGRIMAVDLSEMVHRCSISRFRFKLRCRIEGEFAGVENCLAQNLVAEAGRRRGKRRTTYGAFETEIRLGALKSGARPPAGILSHGILPWRRWSAGEAGETRPFRTPAESRHPAFASVGQPGGHGT